MSLKQDLLDAGVNLSDMARAIPDENYPNLYEVLRKEERGMPIKEGSAQDARLGKLRAYLAGVLDGSVTAVATEDQEPEYDEGGRLIELGDPYRIKQAQTRPLPPGRVLVDGNVRIKGKLCGPGTVINLSLAHGPLQAGNYMFIRALALVDAPGIPYEIDLYGGPGYLSAKTDAKTGFPKWVANYRTVRPDAFSKSRPAIARPRPDSEYTMEDYEAEGDDE